MKKPLTGVIPLSYQLFNSLGLAFYDLVVSPYHPKLMLPFLVHSDTM